MKLTKEMVLAGIDPKKVTLEDLKAFADECNLILPGEGIKSELLANLVEQLNAQTDDAPPEETDDEEPPPGDPDLNLPDAPPEPGEDDEEGDIPPALARRGLTKKKRVIRKKAELPKDAPPALRRRWPK